MARNFSTFIHYNKEKLTIVFVPVMQPNGLHYEVNIKGFPRFNMAWSALGRFDIIEDADYDIADIPYDLVLAASEVLDKMKK